MLQYKKKGYPFAVLELDDFLFGTESDKVENNFKFSNCRHRLCQIFVNLILPGEFLSTILGKKCLPCLLFPPIYQTHNQRNSYLYPVSVKLVVKTILSPLHCRYSIFLTF